MNLVNNLEADPCVVLPSAPDKSSSTTHKSFVAKIALTAGLVAGASAIIDAAESAADVARPVRCNKLHLNWWFRWEFSHLNWWFRWENSHLKH